MEAGQVLAVSTGRRTGSGGAGEARLSEKVVPRLAAIPQKLCRSRTEAPASGP